MDVVVDETAGLRIRRFLDKQRPPTCSEIAAEAGVSRQYVWRILRGRERPSERVLAACQRLGIPIVKLLSERDHQPQRSADSSRSVAVAPDKPVDV